MGATGEKIRDLAFTSYREGLTWERATAAFDAMLAEEGVDIGSARARYLWGIYRDSWVHARHTVKLAEAFPPSAVNNPEVW